MWHAFGKHSCTKCPQMSINNENSITLTLNGSIYWLPLSEIVYLNSRGSYTLVKMIDGREYRVAKNTAHLFQQIPDKRNFIKVHRSWILNSTFLQRLELNKVSKKYLLHLIGGFTVPLAKNTRKEFLQSLKPQKDTNT